MSAATVSAEPDDDAVAEAIRRAESTTSGEIRVFLSRHPCADPAKAARQEFVRLDMTQTPLRNAVLLYVAPKSNALAVAADESVRFRCGVKFEDDIAAAARPFLQAGKVQEALIAAIACAGEHLARHFPPHSLDRDDLPNSLIRD